MHVGELVERDAGFEHRAIDIGSNSIHMVTARVVGVISKSSIASKRWSDSRVEL